MFLKPIMKILSVSDKRSESHDDQSEHPLKVSEWHEIEQAFHDKTVIEGVLEMRTQTGYIVRIGDRNAFMPHYRFDVFQYPHIPLHYRDVTLGFHVIKIDAENKKAQVSHLSVIKEQRREKIQQFERGDICTAEVTSILENGVTLDIKGIPAILHSQDISWDLVDNPHEKLKVGNVINVKILKVQAAKLRLVAGLKQLDTSRWQNFIDRYQIGDIVSAKVTDFTDYGCFLSCDKGVVGLLHQSEIVWSDDSVKASRYVRRGQSLQVKLIAIDHENERLSFSLKQVNPDPWDSFVYQHQVGDIVTGKVVNRTDYGVFIEVSCGQNTSVKGLLHNKDISWLIYGQTSSLNFKPNNSFRVKILNIDAQQKRLGLGLKQLTEDPFKQLKQSRQDGVNENVASVLPTVKLLFSVADNEDVPDELNVCIKNIVDQNQEAFNLLCLDKHATFEEADLIIPLLSDHYLQSQQCHRLQEWQHEPAMRETTFLLPVIISNIGKNHCFSDLAILPPDGLAPSAWISRSTCWHNIEKGIENVVKVLAK